MEPIFAHPDLPRYTQRPFPPCRYLPRQSGIPSPHPRSAPTEGFDLWAQNELPRFSPHNWRSYEPYLYGIDLFNHGYWWEAHEVLEAVWRAAGQRSTVCGQCVQGLIQLAGAQLKRFISEPRGAQSLTQAGIKKLSLIEGIYLGIDVAPLIAEVKRCLQEDRGEFPRIVLSV